VLLELLIVVTVLLLLLPQLVLVLLLRWCSSRLKSKGLSRIRILGSVARKLSVESTRPLLIVKSLQVTDNDGDGDSD
jgi:nucleotide-binding universal stress UspA family protein